MIKRIVNDNADVVSRESCAGKGNFPFDVGGACTQLASVGAKTSKQILVFYRQNNRDGYRALHGALTLALRARAFSTSPLNALT
jgi:hypothetical protein